MIAARPYVACQGRRMLARVFKLVFASIDDAAAQNFLWVPAHTPGDSVGVVCLSRGERFTATDRFGNMEAYRLAKLGFEGHRVPRVVREAVHRHEQLQMEIAMWLGQVTAAAGNWGRSVSRHPPQVAGGTSSGVGPERDHRLQEKGQWRSESERVQGQAA